MDREQAIALVVPIQDRLVACMRAGHDDFIRFHPKAEDRATFGPTTRANYVHDRMRHRFELEFGASGLIRMDNEGQLYYLQIDGPECSVGLRFKKVHRVTLRSCNYPTNQQLQITKQDTFPFACEMGQAILGYVESGDDINPILSRIVLTHETKAAVELYCSLWNQEVLTKPVITGAGLPIGEPSTVSIKPHKHLVKKHKKDRG